MNSNDFIFYIKRQLFNECQQYMFCRRKYRSGSQKKPYVIFPLKYPIDYERKRRYKSPDTQKNLSYDVVYDNNEIVNEEKIKRESSMLSFFNSKRFTIDLLIRFLFGYNNNGITDYLVNLLGKKFLDYSLFYIPQLCAFIDTKDYCESLRFLLLSNCVDHMKFGLILHWTASSMDSSSSELEKFIIAIEETLVNGRLNKISTLDIIKQGVNKFFRNEYIEKVRAFFELLQKKCEDMKAVDPSQRKEVLPTVIEELNTFIKHKNESNDCLLRGVILPFCLNSLGIDDKDNDLIMNIVPEYCFCFQTKARVPIKMVVECIKASEVCEEFIMESQPKEEEEWLKMTNFILEIFGEDWTMLSNKTKLKSMYHKYTSYSLKAFIAKANDDLRQEAMVMQLLKLCDNIFKEANTDLKLILYEIIITSQTSGLIELVPNSMSIDSLKKKFPKMTLLQIYTTLFGSKLDIARKCFANSLAAYSLMTYLFDIKDRHNGNILIDSRGHIIHIDFGFVLGICPGSIRFEKAPFKLLTEHIDVLGGDKSEVYKEYKRLMLKGFIELRKNMKQIILLVNIMNDSSKNFPCFKAENVIQNLTDRFKMNLTEEQCEGYINDLIYNSCDSAWTFKYDQFQYLTNSIYY